MILSESVGISLFAQPDIPLWSLTTGSGVVPLGEDIFPPQESFCDMAQFPDSYFAKSESGSSMDDSAYVSQPDASGRGGSSGQHDNLMNQSFEQFLYSPALSSVSQNGFQGQFPMADSAADTAAGFGSFPSSDAGAYGSSNTFSSPAGLDLNTNSMRQFDSWSSPPFNEPFGISPLATGNHFSQQTINPQFSSQFYNTGDKALPSSQADRRPAALKRNQLPRVQVDTTSVLNPSSLTSPGARPASAHRSTSTRSAPTKSGADAHYEHPANFYKTSSLKSPSSKSVSDFKEDELEEDSIPGSQAAAHLGEDAESKLARTHPLYQATPGSDDMYHCPHEGKQGCTHKPTKLKCNYDKYVDSHLRPYKCKNVSCDGIQFSSTACLLRHEREAHGMHGHGSKPNLCIFPDCERSLPGNGFPRRYNLFDHMKRVHDYTPSAVSPDETSPTAPPSAQAKRPMNRKRKLTMTSDDASEKRQKTIAMKTESNAAPVAPQQDHRAEKLMGLRKEWNTCRSITLHRLEQLQDPSDTDVYTLLTDDVAKLQSIALSLAELGG